MYAKDSKKHANVNIVFVSDFFITILEKIFI